MKLALLVFGVLVLSPLALAVPSSNIPPPASVSVTSAHPISYTTGYGNAAVQYDVYVNFTRSTLDNGSWGYDVCVGLVYTSGSGLNQICAFNQTVTNISNRPGWASYRFTGSTALSGPAPTTNADYSFNVSTNNSAGSTSFATPNINATITDAGSHNQTGNYTVVAPIVKNVTVVQPLTVSTGQTEYVFYHSANDSNASTTGDYRYVVVAQYIQPGTNPQPFPSTTGFLRGIYKLVTGNDAFSQGTPSTTIPVFYDSNANTGTGGLRFMNITYAGTSPFYLSLASVSVDDRTGWIGSPSCLTTVDPSKTSSVNNCGLFVDAGLNVTIPAQAIPAFPGLNVPAFAIATGLTSENTGYLLTAILVFAFALLGFYLAKKPGMVILGALALGLAWFLNLFPTWGLIATFAAATIAVVLLWGGKR